MSSLEELGTEVSAKIATITKLLKARGSPSPSFAETSALDVSSSRSLSEDQVSLHVARNELANLAQDLLHLAQGPIDHIVTLAYAVRLYNHSYTVPHAYDAFIRASTQPTYM